jgi:hypothetical protein
MRIKVSSQNPNTELVPGRMELPKPPKPSGKSEFWGNPGVGFNS